MLREFSAGGVVFKNNLILIRKPAANPEFRGKAGWTLPKGWVDDEDNGKKPGPKASGRAKCSQKDLEEAALREVREEGGVEAKITGKLSTVRYYYKNSRGETVMKFVTYFSMEWVKDLPEGFGWETDEVQWVDLAAAKNLLINASERKLLEEQDEK